MKADREGLIPYVGPRPFERNVEDQQRFFGRDRETEEIVSLTYGHPLVLVYARSGSGKTSLFNACIAPTLEENGFEVLPLSRVRGSIPEGIERQDIANLYVFNALLHLKPNADPRALAGKSLAAFLRDGLRRTDQKGKPVPRVIVFDQFEELFTLYPRRWREEREAFFRQVVGALEADPLLRCVLVLREDYVAQLDPFAPLLPENLRTRFRLERLGRQAALEAIKAPLGGTDRSFAEGVAEQLVEELLKVRVEVIPGEIDEVTGQFIEPVQLQVVCQSLWQGLPPDTSVITREHLQDFGDVDQALADFYERSIERAVPQSIAEEGDLRRWFERSLITAAGTRGTVYRGPQATGGIPNAAVDVLENLHLIRGERRAGARWYELTHDRFIEPIQRSNKGWRAVRQGGIPESRADIIDQARACERQRDWVNAAHAYARLLLLSVGSEEERKRWTLALKRVEEEGELASVYAEAQAAIEQKRWTQASEELAWIRDERPDYQEVARLGHVVQEERQKRKRRAKLNVLIVMGSTGLLGYLSGLWLAGRLGARIDQDLDLHWSGAAATGVALWAAGMALPDVDILDIRGVGKKRIVHVVLRFLSIVWPWFLAEVTILLFGLLAWGAGALTLRVFGHFDGFSSAMGVGLGAGIMGFPKAVDSFTAEPSDPAS